MVVGILIKLGFLNTPIANFRVKSAILGNDFVYGKLRFGTRDFPRGKSAMAKVQRPL